MYDGFNRPIRLCSSAVSTASLGKIFALKSIVQTTESTDFFQISSEAGDAIVSSGVSAEYELAVRPPANGIHGFATPFLPPTAALATSYVLSLPPIYSTLFSSSAAARKPKKTLTFHLPSKFLLFSSHFFYLHLADWSRFMAKSPSFPRKFFKPLTPGFQNGMVCFSLSPSLSMSLSTHTLTRIFLSYFEMYFLRAHTTLFDVAQGSC